MTDIRPDTDGDEHMTGDERHHLELARFEVTQNFTDYTNADLLAALRVGYALGVADGRAQRDREAHRLSDKAYRPDKHDNYPRPTKPERVVDDTAYHGWWRSSCPICGKAATEYTEKQATSRISGHIMGAHAQWGKRSRDRAKNSTEGEVQ